MDSIIQEKLIKYPNLYKIVQQQLDVWPEHEKYIKSRFIDDNQNFYRILMMSLL